jgi:hypothetical protein
MSGYNSRIFFATFGGVWKSSEPSETGLAKGNEKGVGFLTRKILIELLGGVYPSWSEGCAFICVGPGNDRNFDELMLVELDASPLSNKVSVNHWREIVLRIPICSVENGIKALKWYFSQALKCVFCVCTIDLRNDFIIG